MSISLVLCSEFGVYDYEMRTVDCHERRGI